MGVPSDSNILKALLEYLKMSVDLGGNTECQFQKITILKLFVFKMLQRVLLANNWRHAGTELVISAETTFTLQIIKNDALKVSNICLSDPRSKPI